MTKYIVKTKYIVLNFSLLALKMGKLGLGPEAEGEEVEVAAKKVPKAKAPVDDIVCEECGRPCKGPTGL